MRSSTLLLIIVALIFPPAAVAFIAGCSCDLLINVILTILGYFPGHIHAFWLIYKKTKAEEQWGPGGYHYVGGGQFTAVEQAPQPVAQVPPQPSYGAVEGGNPKA